MKISYYIKIQFLLLFLLCFESFFCQNSLNTPTDQLSTINSNKTNTSQVNVQTNQILETQKKKDNLNQFTVEQPNQENHTSSQKQPTEIHIGDTIQQVIINSNKLFYKVKIEKIIPNEDFIVITSPNQQQGGDPDIYLSTEVENPGLNLIQKGVKGCYSIQYDICILKSNELKENGYVYIGISCYRNCSFNLEVRYEQETILTLGDDVYQYFTPQSHAKLFTIQIPNNTSENQPIGHIAFSVEPINVNTLNQTFNFYVKKGSEKVPTTIEYDVKGKASWFNGKSAAIFKESKNHFCTNCNFTMLVEAPPNSLMKISTWTDDEIIDVRLDDKQVDAIDQDGTIFYKLILENDKIHDIKSIQQSDIELLLDPYSGSIQVYINPDTKPAKLSEYHWHIEEDTKTKFILSTTERKKVKASDKVFYIALKATYTATFLFTPTLVNHKKVKYLEFGITESEELDQNESAQLLLKVPKVSDTNITLKLFNEKGSAKVYVKFCNSSLNSTGCKITKNDLKIINEGGKIDNMIILQQKNLFGKQIMYEFQHQSSSCEKNYMNVCAYAVAVYCEKECLYHITPYSLSQHVQLKEGEVEHFSLKKGQKMYYKFALGIFHESIDCVKFNLNTISGQPRLFVSRSEPYPDWSKCDYLSLFESDSIHFTYSELKENITGPYYLTVTSEQSDSYFTLSTEVSRLENFKNTINQQNNTDQLALSSKYIRLTQDVPITQTLHFLQEKNYLYFDVDLPKDFKGSIDITITPTSGKFDIYVSNKEKDPKLDQNMWHTQGDFKKSISIKHSDKNFKNKGTYYIVVEVEDSFTNLLQEFLFGEEKDDSLEGDFRYTIQQTIKATEGKLALIVKEVHEGLPIDGKLQPNSTETYFLKLSENLNKVTLILYTLSDAANLITYKSKQGSTYVNYKNETHTVSAIIKYNSTEINQLCQEEMIQKKECKLYMDIVNNYNHKIDFSFQVFLDKDDGRYTLREGKPLFLPFPKKDESVRILYQPSTVFNGISIIASSKSGDFEIFVKSYDRIKLGSLKEFAPQFKFPESKIDSDYNSIHQPFTTSQSIFINPETIHCGIDCIFAITIKESNDNIVQPSEKEYITLIASTELQQLKDGQPAHGFVYNSTFKYYSFSVNQKETNIDIHLTGLSDSDPNLFVTFGKNTRPTKDKYDWASYKSKGDSLTINKKNFKGLQSMEGTYIIGVYGKTDSSFTITVTFTDKSIIDLQSGFPFEFDMEGEQTIYFNYYHYLNESFTIIGINDYGYYRIYVNSYKKDDNIYEKLPSSSSFDWSNMYIATAYTKDSVRIYKEYDKYCVGCNYLIALQTEPKAKVKGTLLIKVDTEYLFLQPGKPFHDIVENNSHSYYSFLTSEGRDVSLKIKIHFGNPIFYLSSSFSLNKQDPKKSDYILSQAQYADEHIRDFIHIDLPFSNINQKYCQNNSVTLPCSIFAYIIYVDPNGNDVHFTITMSPADKEVLLKEGLTHVDKLETNKSQTYEIYSNEVLNNIQKFNILIHSFDVNHQEKIYGESLLPVVDIKFQKKITDQQKISITRSPTITANVTNPPEHFIHYQIIAENGKYIINIMNPHKFTIKYSILVQTKEITTLTSDEKTYSLISEGDQAYYEISVESPGLLVIRVVQCFGSVDMVLAESIHNLSQALNEKNYQAHLNIVGHLQEENQELYIVRVDQPTLIYLLVLFEDGIITTPHYQTSHKQAYYKLTTKLVPESEESQFKLWKLGQKGAILRQQSKDYEVNFTWYSPFIQLEKRIEMFEDKNLDYFYTIYFARDPQYLKLVSRCGDSILASGSSKLMLLDQTAFSKEIRCSTHVCTYSQQFIQSDGQAFNLLNSEQMNNFLNDQLYATVRVDYKKKGEKYYNSEQYQIDEFQVLHSTSSRTISIYIYIIIGALLIVVGIFSWKYKSIKEKLQFEMQDIRNIARIGVTKHTGYTTQISTYEE